MMTRTDTQQRLDELRELLRDELASESTSPLYVDDLMLSISYCEEDIKSVEAAGNWRVK